MGFRISTHWPCPWELWKAGALPHLTLKSALGVESLQVSVLKNSDHVIQQQFRSPAPHLPMPQLLAPHVYMRSEHSDPHMAVGGCEMQSMWMGHMALGPSPHPP
jgi:hypothetical protein